MSMSFVSFLIVMALVGTWLGPAAGLDMCSGLRNLVLQRGDYFDEGSTYERHVDTALDFIMMSPSDVGVLNLQIGTGSDTVYARAECYGDCGECLLRVRTEIRSIAPRAVSASKCTAQCYIRYDNSKF